MCTELTVQRPAVLCINPHRPRKGVEYGCGQCAACRVNRRRHWTSRILLESMLHPASSFMTLTYEQCPTGGSLSSADWRAFSHRCGFRYFGVGEYGDQTQRPHYHVVAFGVDPGVGEHVCAYRWVHGFSSVQLFEPPHAAYVAGYVVKKMTRPTDERLEGRVPEFARMSRRPGVGVPALDSLARWCLSPQGQEFIERERDVPNAFRFDNKVWPLGRTLVSHLRVRAGVPSDDPVRRERRESDLRAVMESDELRTAMQKKRHTAYDRLKWREKHVPRGVL